MPRVCHGRLSLAVVPAALLILLAALAPTPAAGGQPAPPNRGGALRVVKIADLADPVGFTFTPGGRIVYLERASGEIRFLNPANGHDHLFFRIGGVNSEGERGALGVALHPDWPATPLLYAYVTRAPGGGALRNQLVRLRDADGHGTRFRVLLNSPIQTHRNHNGGRIAFGPDGNLYVVIGDGGGTGATAQDLTREPRGKILRVKPNGEVPLTNPFPGSRVWSYGHRNSIGFAWDPQTGRLWETDNGPACNDEINLISKGGNFAWGPTQDCPANPLDADPDDTNKDGPDPKSLPVWTFAETIAPTGAAFCDGCGLGAAFDGDLFFGCANVNCKNTVGPIGHAGLNAARTGFQGGPTQVPLAAYDGPVYSIEVAPGGRLYFSDFRGIYRLAPA